LKTIFINRYFHPDHSATSQLLTDLATHLAAHGREVHVIASRQLYDDPTAMLASRETHEGIHVHRVWTTRFGRTNLVGRAFDYATFYVSAARRLLSLAAAGDIIVAKTDPPLISAVAAWVARRHGALLVNWLQDVFPDVAQRLGVRALAGPMGHIAGVLRDYSIRTASANVVLGERMARRVAQAGKEGTPVPHVIENWADGISIRAVPHESNPLRRLWDLEGRFVVGYSGNMGRAHEFGSILDACSELRSDKQVMFLFIGAGRQRGWIEAEATRRGLKNIVFRPYQSREALASSLSVADVHLVTLRPALEGLIVPSKFCGIAAAGRPTLFIGDRDGEIARAIIGAECGLVVESGDAPGLAAAIRRLRDDPETVAGMGVRARAHFEARHDRSSALAKWGRLLDSLAPQDPERRP